MMINFLQDYHIAAGLHSTKNIAQKQKVNIPTTSCNAIKDTDSASSVCTDGMSLLQGHRQILGGYNTTVDFA